MLKAYVAAQARLADIKSRLSRLRQDQGGAALVEYALLIGLVAVAAMAALTGLKDKLTGAYDAIGTHLGSIT